VREWVRSGAGVLFIPYRANQIVALRSIIAAWVRLAIFEAMSCPEADQRLWFVMDELDALGAVDGLKDALARLRKFGGRCVLGFQSIAQVSSTYGAGDAQTIVENCGNTLILRCSGSENGGTSHFASRLIGEREIVRRQTSHGRDRDGWFAGRGRRRSISVSAQHVTESAVMPSELEQMPDLTGYLKTASSRCWRHVRIER
jgi:type IV secretory pathway TraG/TraD family ATPase VirD4